MLANINTIDYITDQEGYCHIIAEFSLLPIETFKTEQEATEFIQRYLGEDNTTPAQQKREMFRNFIEIDLRSGVKYRKVRDIFESSLLVI